jgi:hypothetical protein
MANRKQQEGARALSTFIAQLTAADHLPHHERNTFVIERAQKEEARSVARLMELRAEHAFHEAAAAGVRCNLSWLACAGEKDTNTTATAKLRREREHLALCRILIDSLAIVIAQPARNKGDASRKGVLINRYAAAVSGNMYAVAEWKTAAEAWEKAVAHELAAFTCSKAREKQA